MARAGGGAGLHVDRFGRRRRAVTVPSRLITVANGGRFDTCVDPHYLEILMHQLPKLTEAITLTNRGRSRGMRFYPPP
jgi:hypothetical protein